MTSWRCWSSAAFDPGTGGIVHHLGRRRHLRRNADEGLAQLLAVHDQRHRGDDPLPFTVLLARPAVWHLGDRGDLVARGRVRFGVKHASPGEYDSPGRGETC